MECLIFGKIRRHEYIALIRSQTVVKGKDIQGLFNRIPLYLFNLTCWSILIKTVNRRSLNTDLINWLKTRFCPLHNSWLDITAPGKLANNKVFYKPLFC